MNLPKKQRGLTVFGWLMLIIIIGGSTTIGIRLVPHYMDFNNAVSLLEGMSREPGMINKRTVDMTAMFRKRLKLNNIYNFDLKERLKIKRGPDKVTIDLEYEVREPIVANIYVLMIFKHHVQLRN